MTMGRRLEDLKNRDPPEKDYLQQQRLSRQSLPAWLAHVPAPAQDEVETDGTRSFSSRR